MVRFQPPSTSQLDEFDEDYETKDERRAAYKASNNKPRFTAPDADSESELSDGDAQFEDGDDQVLDDRLAVFIARNDRGSLQARRIDDYEDDAVMAIFDAPLRPSLAAKSSFDEESKYADNDAEQPLPIIIAARARSNVHDLVFRSNIGAMRPEEDDILQLASVIASIEPPPPSTVTPTVSDIAPRSRRAAVELRRSFRAGFGVGDHVAVAEGGKVTVTRAVGDYDRSDESKRVTMIVAMLKVHHQFTQQQRQHQSATHQREPSSSSISMNSFLSFSVPSSSQSQSPSSIAQLCDHYIAALTPLVKDSATNSRIAFSADSQIRFSISVFQLVKALFAPEFGAASINSILFSLALPATSSMAPQSSLMASVHDEQYARLQHVRGWLQSQVSPLVSAIVANRSGFDTVFPLLSAYRLDDAVEACLSSGHLRLATLLPSLSSISQSMINDHITQLHQWQNTGLWDVLPSEEKRIFRLLANDLETDAMEWLRALTMYVCYQSDCEGTVQSGIAEYNLAVKHGKARPPLPPYQLQPQSQSVTMVPVHYQSLQRRIIDDDNNDAMSQPAPSLSQSSTANDLRFELLTLSSSPHSMNYDRLYSPLAYTSDCLDYSLSFHLHHSLSFSSLLPYPQYSHLLSSYISQLESAGEWQWAVYCVLQCEWMPRRHRINNDRELQARAIIERHTKPATLSLERIELLTASTGITVRKVPSSVSVDREFAARESWLISAVAVPRAWFDSAKAVSAAYHGDHDAAFDFHLRAEEWDGAHRALVRHRASAYIVLRLFDQLKLKLDMLSAHQDAIGEWEGEGKVFHEFLLLQQELQRMERGVALSDNQEVTERLDSLRSRLMQRVSTMDGNLPFAAVDRLSSQWMLSAVQRWTIEFAARDRASLDREQD